MNEILQQRVLYQLLFSYLFGSTLWGSFIQGVIAFYALPRQQFGMLQYKTFPIFFSVSATVTMLMIGLWVASHSEVRVAPLDPRSPVVAQAWLLVFALVAHASNLFYIGPKTSRVMLERIKLEKAENKEWDDPTASDDVRALNKQFRRLHGICSIVNISTFVCMLVHGIWIGGHNAAL